VELDAAADHSWVTRYELLARRQGGREWFSVGVFNANTDCTSESLASLCERSERATAGVCARYLRVRPLAFHNAKAMRVAVYGTPCANVGPTDRHDAVPRDMPVDEEDTPMVTYSIHRRRGRCCDRKYYTKHARTCSPDWSSRYGDASFRGSKRRQHRSEELARMLPDALGCVTDMDVAVAEPVAEPEPEPVSRDHGECLVTSAQQPVCRGSSSETMDACASAELAVEAGWTVLNWPLPMALASATSDQARLWGNPFEHPG
jgi:hypothetical protein